MYLVPGRHWISIETEGEDYTLTMTPLGPLAAGAELEPNNDSDNAEPLDLDRARSGRLPGAADTDVYRFSLDATEHVAIQLDPPADGAVKVKLLAAGAEQMRLRQPIPGKPLVYDAELPVGDYELTLQSDSGSVLPYQLLVERRDPFVLPADLEPNDLATTARDLPPTLHVEGTGWGSGGEDDDWYRIPAPPDPTPAHRRDDERRRDPAWSSPTVSRGVGIDPDADRHHLDLARVARGRAAVPARHERRRLLPLT